MVEFTKKVNYVWEQRKLEDFGKATGGTSIESEFSEDGVYKVISIGSYSENSVYNDQGIRAIKSDKTSNRVLNRNDLTMILNDKTTSGNIIGRVLLIEESGIYVYNQRTERIEIDLDEYDPVFLYEMLNAPNIREKIIKQAQGNTQIYVNWTAISLLEYMIPSKEEQAKIGEYLHSISNLITLHQREFKYVYCRFIINKYKYISENYICIYTKIYGGLKMNNKLELYHGSGQIVEFPEIRKTRYTKDFSWGFYCTKSYEQAYRWAERKHENGIVNVYSYIENSELNIKKFDGMCEEWLDFIAECRAGKTHPYDIVEGPMADDTIWNFVNDYLNKNISKEVFWEYARFKHPSHQISFHSIRALECLKYERSIAVENDTVE